MQILRKSGFVAFIFFIGIWSCGNENQNFETGGLGVRLIFPDPFHAAQVKTAPSLSASPPNYVRIKVFAEDTGELIEESDAIPIDEGKTTLDEIPVGIVTVRAEGLDDPHGSPIYAGEESGVEVQADEVTVVTIFLRPISE